VEIKASKTQQPNRDWLSFVKTSKARSKILNFINTREKERSLSLGTELLHKGLAEYGVDPSAVLKGKPFDEALQASGFGNFESLLASIGLGKVSTHHFIDKLLPNEKIEARRLEESGQVKLKEKTPDHSGAIHLKCFNDDILLRVGKCCHAVPGDPIVGYITRGRGVTVHHLDCPSLQALESESERLVDVGWGKSVKELHPVRISIVADDKPGQLAEITQVMASCDINITQAHLRQGTNKRACFEFFIEISDLDHLNRMFAAVDNIPGVIHAERIKEYNTSKKGTGKQRSDSQRGNPSKQDSNQETQLK
jgi:GTP pyrophosphokinase